jgi:hypothetical protein
MASRLPGLPEHFSFSPIVPKNSSNKEADELAAPKTLNPDQIINDLEKLKKRADEARAAFQRETAKRDLLRDISRGGYLTPEQKKRAAPLIRKARKKKASS